jgi:light-regulated signal transduction histidine kinase (bacteriophytochrome)
MWLRADATRLEQVFVNLLVNAAKYTAAGSDIRLSVKRENGEAIVRISDTGIGIASDVLPKVFDLFVQVDPSSGRGAISGLGIEVALPLWDCGRTRCGVGWVTAFSIHCVLSPFTSIESGAGGVWRGCSAHSCQGMAPSAKPGS